MRLTIRLAATLGLAVLSSPLRAQAFPTISARQYTEGSAQVTVTGTFSLSADIPINKQASFGDSEMTWLQFGVSGSAEPNAMITYNSGLKEIGIVIGRGKQSATGGIVTGGESSCSGPTQVSATLVSAHYTCKGLTSYDPSTGQMGRVDIDITFTAKS